MRGKSISLSRPRRFIGDLLHFAAQIPTVPTQRKMRLGALVEARGVLAQRPPWSALFMKAFAQVAETIPELRRAFVRFPCPHLYEYPLSVGTIAVQRVYQGEKAVFFGRIKDPARMSLSELRQRILNFRDGEFEQQKAFVQAIWFSGLPRPIRRLAWWLGLNLGRQRGNFFGTFGVTVYSGQGAESLHPLSPLTTSLNYGVISPNGTVNVRIVYDHRVMDGATVALALERLETQLNGSILSELRALALERFNGPPEPSVLRREGDWEELPYPTSTFVQDQDGQLTPPTIRRARIRRPA